MFKRIKNLLDISRYTVEELRQPPAPLMYYTSDKDVITSSPVMPFRTATIISMTEADPFKDFIDETPQQSPDDTTAGDK